MTTNPTYDASPRRLAAVLLSLALSFTTVPVLAGEIDRVRMVDEWTHRHQRELQRAEGEMRSAEAKLQHYREMSEHMARRRAADRSGAALEQDIQALRSRARREGGKALTGIVSVGLSQVAESARLPAHVARAIKLAARSPEALRSVLMAEEGEEFVNALHQSAKLVITVTTKGQGEKVLHVTADGARLAWLVAEDMRAGLSDEQIWEKRGEDVQFLAVDTLALGLGPVGAAAVALAKVEIQAADAALSWKAALELRAQLEENRGNYHRAMIGVQRRVLELEIQVQRAREHKRKAQQAIDGFRLLRTRLETRQDPAFTPVPLLPGEGTDFVDLRPPKAFGTNLSSGPELTSAETLVDDVGKGLSSIGGGIWNGATAIAGGIGSGIGAIFGGLHDGATWVFGHVVQVGEEETGRRRFLTEAKERSQAVASAAGSSGGSSSGSGYKDSDLQIRSLSDIMSSLGN